MNGVTISGITRRELLRATGAGAAVYAAGPLISACRPSSDRPIKVGVLLPYSGIYAVLGESITKGMEMAHIPLLMEQNTSGNSRMTSHTETEL